MTLVRCSGISGSSSEMTLLGEVFSASDLTKDAALGWRHNGIAQRNAKSLKLMRSIYLRQVQPTIRINLNLPLDSLESLAKGRAGGRRRLITFVAEQHMFLSFLHGKDV